MRVLKSQFSAGFGWYCSAVVALLAVASCGPTRSSGNTQASGVHGQDGASGGAPGLAVVPRLYFEIPAAERSTDGEGAEDQAGRVAMFGHDLNAWPGTMALGPFKLGMTPEQVIAAASMMPTLRGLRLGDDGASTGEISRCGAKISQNNVKYLIPDVTILTVDFAKQFLINGKMEEFPPPNYSGTFERYSIRFRMYKGKSFAYYVNSRSLSNATESASDKRSNETRVANDKKLLTTIYGPPHGADEEHWAWCKKDQRRICQGSVPSVSDGELLGSGASGPVLSAEWFGDGAGGVERRTSLIDDSGFRDKPDAPSHSDCSAIMKAGASELVGAYFDSVEYNGKLNYLAKYRITDLPTALQSRIVPKSAFGWARADGENFIVAYEVPERDIGVADVLEHTAHELFTPDGHGGYDIKPLDDGGPPGYLANMAAAAARRSAEESKISAKCLTLIRAHPGEYAILAGECHHFPPGKGVTINP